MCGQVEASDGRRWDVRADAWEVDCDQAMAAAESLTGQYLVGRRVIPVPLARRKQ